MAKRQVKPKPEQHVEEAKNGKATKRTFQEILKYIFATIGGITTLIALISLGQDFVIHRSDSRAQATLLVAQQLQQESQLTLIAAQATQVGLAQKQLELEEMAAAANGSAATATEIAKAIAQLKSTQEASKILVYNFTVSGKLGWQFTGVQVKSGQHVEISYQNGNWAGRAGLGPLFPDIWADANGIGYQIYYDEFNLKTNFASLIGKLGNDAAFPIGTFHSLIVDSSGPLYLRMHDIDMTDNDGSINVQIQLLP